MSGVTDLLTLAVVGGVLYYTIVANPSFLNSIVDKITPAAAAAPAAGGAPAASAPPATGGSSTDSCSKTAYSGNGNSPGWYTNGANAASGSGWGGAPGHHHCDWSQAPPTGCCVCTDPPKCIKSGTPPKTPGSCRPDWGTAGYLQKGGPYPATANFSQCPPGTAP